MLLAKKVDIINYSELTFCSMSDLEKIINHYPSEINVEFGSFVYQKILMNANEKLETHEELYNFKKRIKQLVHELCKSNQNVTISNSEDQSIDSNEITVLSFNNDVKRIVYVMMCLRKQDNRDAIVESVDNNLIEEVVGLFSKLLRHKMSVKKAA